MLAGLVHAVEGRFNLLGLPSWPVPEQLGRGVMPHVLSWLLLHRWGVGLLALLQRQSRPVLHRLRRDVVGWLPGRRLQRPIYERILHWVPGAHVLERQQRSHQLEHVLLPVHLQSVPLPPVRLQSTLGAYLL